MTPGGWFHPPPPPHMQDWVGGRGGGSYRSNFLPGLNESLQLLIELDRIYTETMRCIIKLSPGPLFNGQCQQTFTVSLFSSLKTNLPGPLIDRVKVF